MNGLLQERGKNDLAKVGEILKLPDGKSDTGPLGPFAYLSTIQGSEIVVWGKETIKDDDGINVTVYYPQLRNGSDLMVPGGSPTFLWHQVNQVDRQARLHLLMLALFCGTASLPHILIRYYT